MGAEIRIVSTSRTRPIFDRRWRTTGFNIDRAVLTYSPQRTGGVTTINTAVSNTNGESVSLQARNNPLRAARVLTITPAVKRHSSPLSSAVAALNNASDTRHEARAVSAAATLSGAAQNVRATAAGLCPSVTAFKLRLPQWANLATLGELWDEQARGSPCQVTCSVVYTTW